MNCLLLLTVWIYHRSMTPFAGNILYQSPEIFSGDRHYDGKIDVYSFGILMWETVERKVPVKDGESLNVCSYYHEAPLIVETFFLHCIIDYIIFVAI